SKKTPLTAYIGRYYDPLPLWDELTTAIATDPTLITSAVDARMDIDTSRGPHYGHAFVVPDALAPHDSPMRPVHIVRTVDSDRFREMFLRQAQTDLPAHAQ
ncbi:MAG: nucleoside hydrolase, partial [Komagataeibacter saccharivorans]